MKNFVVLTAVLFASFVLNAESTRRIETLVCFTDNSPGEMGDSFRPMQEVYIHLPQEEGSSYVVDIMQRRNFTEAVCTVDTSTVDFGLILLCGNDRIVMDFTNYEGKMTHEDGTTKWASQKLVCRDRASLLQ